MSKSLQIATQNQLVKLTDGQTGLLELINDCVKNNRQCDFESIVLCYTNNVRKTYVRESYYYVGEYPNNHKVYTDEEHDVYQAYKENSPVWTYRIRGLVKQWFISTIGLLVLKGKLIILPIINIED